MTVLTNVFRRGGIYYFRARVPLSLRSSCGRNELWRSLKTSDPGEARRLGGALHGLTETLWSALRLVMNESEAQSLIDGWLKAELDRDAEVRRAGDRAAVTALEAEHDDVLGGALWRKNTNDPSIASRHVDELIVAHGLVVTDRDRDMATRLMMRAHLELFRAVTSRAAKRWRPWLDLDPAAPLVGRLEGNGTPTPVKVPSIGARKFGKLSTLSVQAINDIGKLESFRPKRFKDYQAAVDTFRFAFGGDCDLGDITPEVAGRYIRDLTRYPSNPTKRLPYRDLKTFSERVDFARTSNDPNVLNPITINGKYITPMRKIFAWAQVEHPNLVNPFENLRADRPRKIDPRSKRRDLTDNEVRSLFSQPLFTEAAGARDALLYKPGEVKVNDWRFWIPLICMFTGMRLNEACGLAVADIKQEDGIKFFHVRDEVEGQSLKSVAARRKVPLHDILLDIGIMNFVDRQRVAGRVRLFQELEQDANGYFSGPPSKFFNRLLARIADDQPDDPGRLVFHSTRHTVITCLRTANVREDVSKEIVGHEQGEVHGGYGSVRLPALKEAIDKISYRGFDAAKLGR